MQKLIFVISKGERLKDVTLGPGDDAESDFKTCRDVALLIYELGRGFGYFLKFPSIAEYRPSDVPLEKCKTGARVLLMYSVTDLMCLELAVKIFFS